MAFELIDWSNLMGEVVPRMAGKTGVTMADIDHAKGVDEQRVVAAGLREQGPAAERRARARSGVHADDARV